MNTNMTEWDKLQAGLVYNDFDDDLFQRRVSARKLFRAYNKTDDEEVDLRQELMKNLFRHVGSHFWIEPDFRCEFHHSINAEERIHGKCYG